MTRSSPFVELCAELLGSGRRVRFQAIGRSMGPTIRDGERITVEPVEPENVGRGDVILYRQGRGVVAHRVARIERRGREGPLFFPRGDASEADDAPVAPWQLLGRVVATERRSRRIPLAGWRGRLLSALRMQARWARRWVLPLRALPAAGRLPSRPRRG